MNITKQFLPIFISIALFSAALLFTGCPESGLEEIDFKIKTATTIEGENFEFDQRYTLANGTDIEISNIYFYLSDINLVTDANTEEAFSEVELFRLKDQPELTYTVANSDYVALNFNLGLDESLNGVDPVDYAPEHPLSTAQNTYWSWASKYKFLLVEGKVYTDSQSNEFDGIAYHVGMDGWHKATTLNLATSATTELTLSFDVARIFDDLDLSEQNVTHTDAATVEVAETVMNNFATALSL
ncbi:MAG: MbnP family protein [Chitinophagales bacterium]